MLKYIHYILALGLVMSMVACHKNDVTLLTHQLDTHTTYDLDGVTFVNDSVGYICGGSRYVLGIVLKTTDGGRTWSTADSVNPRALYSPVFFSAQEGLLAGFDGSLSYTNDSAHTFTVTHIADLAIQHISFINRQKGVAACGVGYKGGYIYNTQDGGANWTRSCVDSMHSLIGASYLDDTTVVVCGYGTIWRSHDAGVTYSVVRENGDFYQDVKFVNSTGYAVGYQGEILKSIDRGLTWYSVKGGTGLFGSPQHLLGVDFIDENNGYAVGESGLMVHTSNGGTDWQKVKAFTSERLRGIHMFSATSGIVVGAEGKAYLFQQ